MNRDFVATAQSVAPRWARHVLTIALLYFPVCGLSVLPMGGGGRYLSVLAGPLAVLFLLVWHRRERTNFAAPAWHFASPLLPWLVASLIVVAVYPDATIGDPFSRVLWALTIALAAARIRVSRNAIFSAAAIGSLAYCAVAVYEVFVLHADRAGIRINPVIFAETAMLTSGLALAGAYAARGAGPVLRVLWLVAGIAGLGAVALSGARGPMSALIALAILLARDGWQRGYKRAVGIGLVSLVSVLSVLLLLTPLGDRFLLAWAEASNYMTTHANQNSIGIRLEFWRIALASIAERPLLGYGYTTVLDLSRQISALKFLPPEILEGLHHFHSDWFHALMAGGLVLTIGLAATVAALAWQARNDVPRQWLLGAMLVFGLTDLAFFRKPTVTLFIAAWALLFANPARPEHAPQARPLHR